MSMPPLPHPPPRPPPPFSVPLLSPLPPRFTPQYPQKLYQANLLRSVRKTAAEGLFPLFLVDSPHASRRDLEDVWGAAKRAGFEAYVVDLFDVGLQVGVRAQRQCSLSLLIYHLSYLMSISSRFFFPFCLLPSSPPSHTFVLVIIVNRA